MAGAITLDIAMNTRDVLRGARDVGEALDDVADSLDDLTRDTAKSANKAGDKLADGIKGGTKEADASLEKLERGFKELSDTSARESKQAGDALATNLNRGTTRAKQDLGELKNEARQNASETFSSFDGSVQSFADGVQGTLGGIVSSLGPIGAVAGAAGALGIGLIISAFDKAGTESEDYKAKVAELATQLIETGNVGAPAIEYIAEQLKSLATETDDAKTSLDDLRDVADKSGSSYEDLANAYAGNTDNLDELVQSSKDYTNQLIAEAAAASDGVYDQDALYDSKKRQADAQQQYTDYLTQAQTAANEAAQAEQNYIDAGGKAMETRAAAVETYQSALDDSLGSFDEFKNAETGALDPAAYIAGIQARVDATSNFNSNVQSLATQFGLTDDEVQAILDQGLDFAPMLQSIMDSGLAPEFVSQLQTAVGGGQEILDGSDLSATADVDADTDKAKSATDAFTSQKRETTVQVKADTKAADAALDATAKAQRTATITATVDTSAAERALTNLTNKARNVTIVATVQDRNGKPVV